MQDGTAFRVIPDLTKLREVGRQVFMPESVKPWPQQFRERVLAACKANPHTDIRKVEFAKITGRDGQGRSFRMPFELGDYARIEQAKQEPTK